MNLCHRLGSGDLTPTIAGMGARIKSYKKRIKAAKKSKEKPHKIRLISLEALARLKPGEN